MAVCCIHLAVELQKKIQDGGFPSLGGDTQGGFPFSIQPGRICSGSE